MLRYTASHSSWLHYAPQLSDQCAMGTERIPVKPLLVLAMLACLSCSEQGGDSLSISQDPRKLRTETELSGMGIPINPSLPRVESEVEVRLREPRDVAERIVVLHALAALAHGAERERIVQFLEAEKLEKALSPSERLFLEAPDPPPHVVAAATWRIESVVALLWALGRIDQLDLPTDLCDTQQINELLPAAGDVSTFVTSARLRDPSSILDEVDRIYRIHWAVREAQLKGRPVPAKLNPGVVVERHYALNWLVFYADEWDDVTTDT